MDYSTTSDQRTSGVATKHYTGEALMDDSTTSDQRTSGVATKHSLMPELLTSKMMGGGIKLETFHHQSYHFLTIPPFMHLLL